MGTLLLAGSFFEVSSGALEDWLLALALMVCLVLADRFPIHLRYATKLTMTSVPLFLIATLLPRAPALTATLTGLLLAIFLSRKERGYLLIDFIMIPARWVIIVFAAHYTVHLLTRSSDINALLLLVAASIMFISDVVAFSLFTSLGIKEPFFTLTRDVFRQAFGVESIQYLIGILGALAYQQAAWSLLLLAIPTIVAYITAKNLKEMRHETRQLLVNMADAVDLRDIYTGGHSRRVAELVTRILRRMQIAGVEVELIETAARLHDIGKIDVPDSILQKKEILTAEEFAIMRKHSERGSQLLSTYPDFTRGAAIVLAHHERWDGKGYPRGLKAHEIPFGARVIAVADGFDAMTTDRPYRSRKTLEQAIQELQKNSGTQWDPEIAKVLVALIQEDMAPLEASADLPPSARPSSVPAANPSE